jgi:hypothetical protein
VAENPQEPTETKEELTLDVAEPEPTETDADPVEDQAPETVAEVIKSDAGEYEWVGPEDGVVYLGYPLISEVSGMPWNLKFVRHSPEHHCDVYRRSA